MPPSGGLRKSYTTPSRRGRLMPSDRRTLRPPRRALQLVVDHLGEGLEGLGAADEAAIDEEGRRPGDAEPRAFLDVGRHRRLVLAAGHARVECAQVEPDLLRIRLEV